MHAGVAVLIVIMLAAVVGLAVTTSGVLLIRRSVISSLSSVKPVLLRLPLPHLSLM